MIKCDVCVKLFCWITFQLKKDRFLDGSYFRRVFIQEIAKTPQKNDIPYAEMQQRAMKKTKNNLKKSNNKKRDNE